MFIYSFEKFILFYFQTNGILALRCDIWVDDCVKLTYHEVKKSRTHGCFHWGFFTVIMASREGLMGNVLQHSGSSPPPCLEPVLQNTRSSTALGEISFDACIYPLK